MRTGDDFLVAGRSLPARVLVFTLLSTWIGSGSLFAGAGLGYRVGFPALWQSAGAWAGIALIYFLASRVRRLAQYTVPEILETRYGRWGRVLGTTTMVLAYTTIAAYQFRGGGRLLHLISGVDPRTGAFITAVFCVAYTAFAGMLSIAYLDVANGIMMIAGCAVAVAYLAGHSGGPDAVLHGIRPDQLTLFGAMSPFEAIALFLPTLFLLLGEANMYQKFFSARDERAARTAVIGWIAGTILVETLIVSIGVFGSVAVPGLGLQESETIVVRVAIDVLPAILGVLLVAGAAAIIVSTATSFLLTPATSLTSRRVPAIHQSGGGRSTPAAAHPFAGRGARHRGVRGRQLLSDNPGDGAVGLHDVRRGRDPRAPRGAGVARGVAASRCGLNRRRHGHNPHLGSRRARARRLSTRYADHLSGAHRVNQYVDSGECEEGVGHTCSRDTLFQVVLNLAEGCHFLSPLVCELPASELSKIPWCHPGTQRIWDANAATRRT